MDSNFLPPNFLVLAAKAMAVLYANGKDNLIYHAACCFGEQRHGNTGPRMPLDRMPFGLIAHNLKLFASDKLQMTTSHGVNQCTHCLVTNGHQCTWVQCGLMR